MSTAIYLPVWENAVDRDAICRRISDAPATLKVILKTKNEALLLPIWLEHYLGFLAPHEIIIADNGSTDSAVLDIYANLPPEITLFRYQADLGGSFHNNIHDRRAFGALHRALAQSCRHVLMADSDELLILAGADSWTTDRPTLLALLQAHSDRALPTLWLEALPGSREICTLDNPEKRLVNALAWGKPFVPSDFGASGARIHTGQFPKALFDSAQPLAVLLHIPNYSARHRLQANREKLTVRGFLCGDEDFAAIAAMDASTSKDPTVARLINETRALLDRPNPQADAPPPNNSIRFAPDGRIEIIGTLAKRFYNLALEDLAVFLEDAFTLAHSVLNNKTGGTPSAAATAPPTLTEIALREELAAHPEQLDQYGDPTFRKELVRLLLSQNRLDEATALIPADGGTGTPGWHHILFARALDKAGRKDAARTHWQAFLAARPHHPEAMQALAVAPVPVPEGPMMPRMTGAELVTFQRVLKGVERFLEFGAGGSTALAARSGVTQIVSVESDRTWLDRLAGLPEMAGVAFTPFHVDIGPIGAWGMPTNPASAPKWPGYHQAVWKTLSWAPDLVLVDGRFRVACTLATVLNCRPGTPVVIHDFWDRPQYHGVLRYLDTVERVDTLGVFRIKEGIEIRELVADLLEYAGIPA